MTNRTEKRMAVSRATRSFLSRLRSSTAGNVAVMVGASMLPMAGMVGGAVEMSRIYVAKSRLQQACDAGILAGRKKFTGGSPGATVPTDVSNEISKYFNHNWPSGTMGSDPITLAPSIGANDTLALSVSTTIPATVMKLFNQTTFSVTASCVGRDDYANIDIMLVLDVTGSMNCLPSYTSPGACTYQVGSKVDGLKSAVSDLYDTMKVIEDQFNTQTDTTKRKRIRWGIVPYSMTVNVGKVGTLGNVGIDFSSNWVQTTSTYRNGASSTTSVTHNATWFSTTHDGCIEERNTVDSITATSGYTIPAGAKDLDIHSVPLIADETTKWRPTDPAAVTVDNQYACPTKMRRLATLANKTELTNYMNSLVFAGATYHDIGMIWGARLMSKTGIWSGDHPAIYNTFPTSRHIIFMTDGIVEPNLSGYSAYGVERYDKRISPNSGGETGLAAASTSAAASHRQRFKMVCNVAKADSSTVWVVQYGAGAGSLSQDMKDCSSGDGYAVAASDTTALRNTFKNIGENIGSLRLAQ